MILLFPSPVLDRLTEQAPDAALSDAFKEPPTSSADSASNTRLPAVIPEV